MRENARKNVARLLAAMLLALAFFAVACGQPALQAGIAAAYAEGGTGEGAGTGDGTGEEDGPRNEMDGSKIESIEIHWITPDSANDNEGHEVPMEARDEAHLFIATKSNNEVVMKYQVEVAFSGQYDYPPGTITITVPAQVWHGRVYDENNIGHVGSSLVGTLDVAVPKAPSTAGEFNWEKKGNEYVFTNTKTINATSKVMLQVEIRDLIPSEIVDMSECDPITAHVEVVTNQENIIEDTSLPIVAQIDTYEIITGARKGGSLYEDYEDVPAALLQNLPEGTTPDQYVYVQWYTYVYHTGNQPFTLKVKDLLFDAYVVGNNGEELRKATDGIFLGCTTRTNNNTDTNWSFGTDIITFPIYGIGGANDHVIEMWSAYLAADMPAPAMLEQPIKYQMKNYALWTLTEADAEYIDTEHDKGTDEQKVTEADDYAVVNYIPLQWQYPPGHFFTNKWTEYKYNKDYTYAYLNRLMSGKTVNMNFILESRGFGLPWTTQDIVENAESFETIPKEHFNKRGWRQVTDDYQTFFNLDNSEQLTSRDFEIKSFRVGIPTKMRYDRMKKPGYAYVEGTAITRQWVEAGGYAYIEDGTLPNPDLIIEYKVDNEDVWRHAAIATWGETGVEAFHFVEVSDEVTVSDASKTVYFPPNTTDFRYTFTSNVCGGKTMPDCKNGAIIWDVYTTMALKPSPEVIAICNRLYELSDTPTTKFENDDQMWVDGWVLPDDVDSPSHAHLTNNTMQDCDTCVGLGLINRDSSFATLEGIGYGVQLEKKVRFNRLSTDKGGDNDVEHQRAILHYTATLTESSNAPTIGDYAQMIEDGVITEETEGVWYDLLPEGVSPLLNTVRLGSGDLVTNVDTITNYKDTNRTLLIVYAKLNPNPVYTGNGYADRHYLYFDAAYPWDDIKVLGAQAVNYIAFETKIDSLINKCLGTWRGMRAESDTNPLGGFNMYTPEMPAYIARAMTELDQTDDPEENRFVYAKATVSVDTLTYAVSGLVKHVCDDLVGLWTTGLADDEQVTIYEGHDYTYRIVANSSPTTITSNIVIYDTVENYIIPNPEDEDHLDQTKAEDYADKESKKFWQGDWEGVGKWRGTVLGVDLSDYIEAGVAPVLYVSVIPAIQFEDSFDGMTHEEKLEMFSSGTYDVADGRYWTRVELDDEGKWEVPAAMLGKVSAVAFDARTGQDGQPFILEPDQRITAYVHMRAPDDESDPDLWHAKGAYAHKYNEATGEPIQEVDWDKAMEGPANNMYAFNNTRMCCVQAGVAANGAMGESSAMMIRNDYTRVGILPTVIGVVKRWEDQDNHDNIRPDSVKVSLKRRLAGTNDELEHVCEASGEPVEAILSEENDWSYYFLQADVIDEDGRPYEYVFEEEPVEGYTQHTYKVDDNHYALVNVHPNEKVHIAGEKIWEGDEADLTTRPESVTVILLQDGNRLKTLSVTPDADGRWKYDFGDMDKYARGGIEHVYTVQEVIIPKYLSETEGYEQIKNTYYPFGELIVEKQLMDATDVSKEKLFDFTLYLFAEQSAEDAAANKERLPVLEPFQYDIMEKQDDGTWAVLDDMSGEIRNGQTIQLKGDQRLVVHKLPSESTYEVREGTVAGFRTFDVSGDNGTIHTHAPAEAVFVNRYTALGELDLVGHKTLHGHALRKNQFRFEIVDKTPGSDTFDQVVSTAGNAAGVTEQPEAGAGAHAADARPVVSAAIAQFGQLTYNQADHGKDFFYEIYEVDGEKPGYKYSTVHYNVKVHVEDNGDGTMTVTAVDAVTGESVIDPTGMALEFDNTYEAKGELTFKAWKVLDVRPLQNEEFEFELYHYDPVANAKIGAPLETVKNDADGNVVFSALTFTQDYVDADPKVNAKYSFLIVEKPGTDATVNYSTNEYVITVTVFDNNDGTLSFAQDTQVGIRQYDPCGRCGGTGEAVSGAVGKVQRLYSFSKSGNTMYGGTSDEVPFDNNGCTTDLCIKCLGTCYVGGEYCTACGGSGLQIGGSRRFPSGGHYDFMYVIYREGDSRPYAYVDYYNSSGALSSTPYAYRVKLPLEGQGTLAECPDCGGTGIGEPAGMTIQGDAALPVFNNTLKDGAIEVKKLISGENVHPDQVFNFKIQLTGAHVPTTLGGVVDKESNLPTGSTGSGTTSYSLGSTTPFHATEEQLQGEAYAVLNSQTGELVFFRSSATDPVDPEGHHFGAFPSGSYKKVQSWDGVTYYYYGNFEKYTGSLTQNDSSTSESIDRPWRYELTGSKIIKSVRMVGAVRPYRTSEWFDSWNNNNLTSIDLSMLDTSQTTIFYDMFWAYGAAHVPVLNLSTFDFSAATSIAYLFCTRFDQNGSVLMLPDYNLSNISQRSSQTYTDTIYAPTVVVMGNNTKLGSCIGPTNTTWVNVADTSETLSGTALFTGGNHGGIWIKKDASVDLNDVTYTVNFDAGEGTGQMTAIKVVPGYSFTFTPTFVYLNHKMVYFEEPDSGKTFPVDEDGTVTVPSSAFVDKRIGDSVTLVAHWISSEKTLTSDTGIFEFSLYGNQSITFENIPAGLAFDVWEEVPAGWVLVSKVDDSGIVQPLETSTAVFTNEYSPNDEWVYLRATKTLDELPVENEAFSFTLADTDPDSRFPSQTVKNLDGGAISFEPIKFKRSDMGAANNRRFVFRITEVAGEESTIKYDEKTYDVYIDLHDDGHGNLISEVRYEGGAEPTFRNTTYPGSLVITKTIGGTLSDAAKQQQFKVEVTLYNADMAPWAGNENGKVELEDGSEVKLVDGMATLLIKGGESIKLVKLPVGLRYHVSESAAPDKDDPNAAIYLRGWTVDTTEYEGVIAAGHKNPADDRPDVAAFTNTYALSGNAYIEATKVLSDRKPIDGNYTFRLLGDGVDQTEENQMVLETEEYEENGEIKTRMVERSAVKFEPVSFTEEGTYYFTIQEIPGDDETLIYSDEIIDVTVVMFDDNGDGNLSSTVTYNNRKTGEGNNVITNVRRPGDVVLTKTVLQGVEANKDKEFTFTVKLFDKNGLQLSGEYEVIFGTAANEPATPEEAVEDGEAEEPTAEEPVSMIVEWVNGAAELKLKGGMYAQIRELPHGATYTVTEKSEDGFVQTSATFDTHEIVGGHVAHADFVNTYQPTGEYVLSLHKELEDAEISEGQFMFKLLDEMGTELESVTNDAEGNASFAKMIFDPIDVGTTIYYVREEDLTEAGYIYDKTLYTVTMNVIDDGSGVLTADVKIEANDEEKDELLFTNGYSEFMDVSATKIWVGDEEMKENRIDIGLRLFANTPSIDKWMVDEKVIPKDAEGDDLTVTWEDLPIFTEDENAERIVYTVEEFVATPTDLAEGEPLPTMDNYLCAVMGTAESGFQVYNRSAYAELDIEARKLVEGETPDEDQVYTFVLTDEEGNVLETVENDGETVAFTAIKYNSLDIDKTFKYTVAEVDAEYVIIDESKYTITVEITDVDGVFIMTTAVEKDGEAWDEGMVFDNTLKRIDIGVTKTWDDNDDQDGKRPEEIEVLLLDGGEVVDSMIVKPDEDGIWIATFTDLLEYHGAEKAVYTIEETPVDEYEVEVVETEDGRVELTNIHIPETVTIPVTKTWDDDNNKRGMRAESIEIELTCNGDVIDTLTLSEENDWAGEFIDLPVYVMGEKQVYDVNEIAVDGYAIEKTGSVEEGFAFTNKLLVAELDIVANKRLDNGTLKANQFAFDLSENGKVLSSTKNAADGKIAFKTIEWLEKDIGTHTLTVSEVNDGQKNITYDSRVFTLTVEVKLDENGELISGVTGITSSDGKKGIAKVLFVNKQEKEPEYPFTFTKKWSEEGEHPTPKFVLYDQKGNVVRGENQQPKKTGANEYTYWLSKPGEYYVQELEMDGWEAVYTNYGGYISIIDRAYEGGVITNNKVPDTGDRTDLALYMGLAVLALAMIAAALQPKRKGNK